MPHEIIRTNPVSVRNRRGVAFARKAQPVERAVARGRVVSLFEPKRWPTALSILTLPGVTWTFERRLLCAREGNWEQRTRPAQSTYITGCEIDPAIFAAATVTIPRTAKASVVTFTNSPRWTTRTVGTDAVRRFHHCDVYELMKHNDSHFGAAWLDFTGTLTSDRLVRIAEFYNRWVVGILVLTFMYGRRDVDNDVGDVLEWVTDALPGNVLQFFHYADGPAHMVQLAISHHDFFYEHGDDA